MKSNAAKILGAIAIMVFVFGCKKNDGKGKFYLSLKDLSNTKYKTNEVIPFEFEFSHPDNEIQNDTLFYYRVFYTCPYVTKDATYKNPLPEFTATKDYIGNVTFNYAVTGATQGPCNNGTNFRTDSCHFYFWLKNKNGLTTDTIKSQKIILLKP